MAKPAAKKKTQGASRNTPAPAGKGAPGWVWLVAGFVTACFVFFLIHLKQGGGSIGKILPAIPGSASTATSGAKVATGADSGDDSEAEGGKDQHYDFYSLLPNQKMVPNKDAEDAATKAATAAAALAGKKQAAMAAADQAAASGSTAMQSTVPTEPSSHVAEPGEPKPAVPVAPIAHEPMTPPEPKEKAEPREKPEAAVAKPAKGSFFLQAGSFKSESEADRRRASILLLGLPVKTQMVEKDAQNWFRVIVGPMDSKDSLDSARNALQGSGIQTVPVKKG
jgi:cell division protein FtsN